MPTTTNYGWTTPADTDLVKDGASAIRTLGTAIDTTVFNNASAAIAKTIVDAKGDIIAATAADTVSRLAVGANDTVLTADSSTATGLKWATPSAGGMTLINTGGTTLTGSSVTISSIPSTYKHLQLIVRNYKPVVDEDGMAIRFNNDSTANRYMYSATNPLTTTFDESQIVIQQTQDNTNAEGFSVTDIFDYTNTTTWKCCFINYWSNNATTSTQVTYSRRFGIYNQTGAITEILIRSNSGNFTSGTAYLYGVS